MQAYSLLSEPPGKPTACTHQGTCTDKEFSEKQKLRMSTASMPALQESLKGVLRGEHNDTN